MVLLRGADYTSIPYGQYTAGPAPMSAAEKLKVSAQLATEAKSAGVIHSKWNYYAAKWGTPTSVSQAQKIKDAIAADLVKEGTWGNRAFVESVIGSGVPLASQIATNVGAIVDKAKAMIPWYLQPKLLIAGAAGLGLLYIFLPTITRSLVAGVKEARKK